MSAIPHPPRTRWRTGPRRVGEIYTGIIGAELQAASAYRVQLVLSAVQWVVPLAFLALWRSAAGSGDMQGITATQFATYFSLLLATTTLQIPFPLLFDTGQLIYTGRLSALLLHPVHPMHRVVGRALAGQAYRLLPLVALVPLAVSLTGGRVVGGPGDWTLAIVVTVLGTIGFAYLAAMVGTVALWMTKAQGVQGLLVGGEWILGGLVAPVALLPGILPELVRHQPIYFADAAGPEILSGIGDHGWGMALEAAAWVVALHLLYARVWRRGLRRYEAVGS